VDLIKLQHQKLHVELKHTCHVNQNVNHNQILNQHHVIVLDKHSRFVDHIQLMLQLLVEQLQLQIAKQDVQHQLIMMFQHLHQHLLLNLTQHLLLLLLFLHLHLNQLC
jgi:hypothetical protein